MFALLFALLACSTPSEDSFSSPSAREPVDVAADQETECVSSGQGVTLEPSQGVPYVMWCSPVSRNCGLETGWVLTAESLIIPCTPGDTVSVIWL